MYKFVCLVACCIVASNALAAGELFSNHGIDRRVPALNAQLASESGQTVAQVNGSQSGFWSECQNETGVSNVANSLGGQSFHNVVGNTQGAFRVADDFVLPAGRGFVVEKVRFYGYRTGSTTGGGTPVVLPALSASVRFWGGLPGVGTALSSGAGLPVSLTDQIPVAVGQNANVFRIFNSVVPVSETTGVIAPNCGRKIYQVEVTLENPSVLRGPALTGTSSFFLDFGLLTNLTSTTPSFTAIATFEGARSVAGANARTLGTAGAWSALFDSAQGTGTRTDAAQELPFILVGKWIQSPTEFEVLQGETVSGGLEELTASDNLRFSVLSDSQTLQTEIAFSMPSPFGGGSSLKVSFEFNVERGGVAVQAFQFNHSTQTYVAFYGGTASGGDAVVTHTFSSEVASYLAGPVRTKIKFSPVNDEAPSQDGWGHNFDELYWTVGE